MDALLNSDSHYESGTLSLLWNLSAVDFRRLQALGIQTLDIRGDRGDLQAPVQRATNKRAGRADILTRQISRKAVSESQHAYVRVNIRRFSQSRLI
jgi:hypothetical protein